MSLNSNQIKIVRYHLLFPKKIFSFIKKSFVFMLMLFIND
jgi:hypothetical protein